MRPIMIIAWSFFGAFTGLAFCHIALIILLTCIYLFSPANRHEPSMPAILLLFSLFFIGGITGFLTLSLRRMLPGTK